MRFIFNIPLFCEPGRREALWCRGVGLKTKRNRCLIPDGATQVICSYKAFTLALESICFYTDWVRGIRSPADQALGRYMALTALGVEDRNEWSYSFTPHQVSMVCRGTTFYLR